MKDALAYGTLVALVVWFVGWSTGLGGSFGPNILFAIAMGIFAGVLFLLVKKYAGRG